MRWPIGGNFELPTWFITIHLFNTYVYFSLLYRFKTGALAYSRKDLANNMLILREL
jgi:hypothetical protein